MHGPAGKIQKLTNIILLYNDNTKKSSSDKLHSREKGGKKWAIFIYFFPMKTVYYHQDKMSMTSN